MDSKEYGRELEDIDNMRQRSDWVGLLAHAAVSLMRTANAQEALVELASLDLEAAVEDAVKTQAEERASEMVAEQSKRSFIGKKG